MAERDRVLSAIDAIITTAYVEGSTSILSGGIQRDVMMSSDASFGFVEDIARISGEQLPTEERGGVSDANIVSSCGVITLDGFGPFGDGDHTVHERANKQSFDERIALSKSLIGYFIKNSGFKE
jgi:glutamate carboxypeptidase